MKSVELISIIVPVYNVEKELSRCIESIINQSYKNLEIILVNDGSLDSSLSICKKYENIDKRIIIIDQSNKGLSAARNAGLEKATGNYILFVDSDDFIELDACEKLISGFQNDLNKNVDFVVGALKEVREGKNSYQKHSNLKPFVEYSARNFIISSITNNEWYAPAVLNLYRRSFLIQNHLFFKVGRYYEDLDILPRIYMSANKIVYVDYAFYNYIIRAGSITTSINSTNANKKRMDSISIYKEWKKTFDQIQDMELRKELYGFLIKCYLTSCRVHKITDWEEGNMNFSFAFINALCLKERLKVLLFSMLPKIYLTLK